jgi:hypothetical protein
MQITIDLPDNLPLTEADVRIEIAIVLYQQHSLSLDIITPPADPDDEPAELVLASLRNSLQQIKEGKLHPISELWEGIDD